MLHGGVAAAAYALGSLTAAAALAEAVARVPGLKESGALLTVSDTRPPVRLTRGLERIESVHVGLARAVSAVARQHGAVADRGAVQEVQIAVAARPGELDVGFWRAVLGYATLVDDNGVDPLGHGSRVWMQDLDPAKPLRHAMHVDGSLAREYAEERLAAAVAGGGRIVDESAAPAARIPSDRAGNRVCIAAWPDGAQRPAGSPRPSEWSVPDS